MEKLFGKHGIVSAQDKIDLACYVSVVLFHRLAHHLVGFGFESHPYSVFFRHTMDL